MRHAEEMRLTWMRRNVRATNDLLTTYLIKP